MTGSLREKLYYRSPLWLQNSLVTAYGYYLYRKRYTRGFREILEVLKESRTWSQKTIEEWQAERLFLMVKHCRAEVPYYQKLFAEYGLTEQDFTSVAAVKKLPVLKKGFLKENRQAFRARSVKPFMLQHTSGSTGTPLSLAVDERTYKLAMALLVDLEANIGIPSGARKATFAGRMIQPASLMKPPFARFNRAENQKLFSSYHLNDQTFPWYAQALNKFSPVEIIGYPSAISDLASHYEKSRLKPSFNLKAIITNSETLFQWQREKMESIFQCPVVDYYGTAEYVLFAHQDQLPGYRVNPVIGITEILGEEDEPASSGRIIATSLSNKAMPLLRYEVGDTAEADEQYRTHSICSRIKNISGRVDDYVELPDGRRIGRLDHIFKDIPGLREAQIIQDSRDHCMIALVLDSKASNLLKDTLIKNFRQRTGSQLDLSIVEAKSIKRGANGKFRGVIRTIPGEMKE